MNTAQKNTSLTTSSLFFITLLLLGGMLLLAGGVWLTGQTNLALLFVAAAVFYAAFMWFATPKMRSPIEATAQVKQALKFSLKLAGVAVVGFAVAALWFNNQGVHAPIFWVNASPWLLALTPFFFALGIVRAFHEQRKQLEQIGITLRHTGIMLRLAALENIFLNRTGVVTAENMSLQVVVMPDGTPVLLKGLDFDASKRKQMWRLAAAATLCNQTSGENVALGGDGVDMAFMRFARRMNLNRKALLRRFPLQDFRPFDPQQRFEASVHKHGNKTLVAVKGAPEVVAQICGTPNAPWLEEVENLAHGGYRAIAVAGGEVPPRALNQSDFGGDLTFLGLVALVDPLKERVAENVAACQAAGVKVALLSGDHPATTLATAKQLGIAARHSELVSSADLPEQSSQNEDFNHNVQNAAAFARLTPAQKQNVVASCTAQGDMTAVYGHTSQDDAALSAGHVSIRSQHLGGEQKPADVVLAKGAFDLLPRALECSRLAISNARKTSCYLLGLMVAQVGALTGFAILDMPSALNAADMLWVNVFLMALLVLPFAKEPAEKALMQRASQSITQPILDKHTLGRIVLDGSVMAAILVGATLWQSKMAIFPSFLAQNLPLNTLVALAIGYVFFARTGEQPLLKSAPWQNPLLWGMVVLVVTLQVAIVLNGDVLQQMFAPI